MNRMQNKNIVITAATLYGNKGAEGMLRSITQNLSKDFPNMKFTLLSYYVKKDKLINKDPNLEILNGKPLYFLLVLTPASLLYYLLKKLKLPYKILHLNKVIRRISKADLVIDIAGISFVDGREKYLLYNVPCMAIPLLMGKKTIKVAQAMGPFNNKLNKYFAKIILPKITRIFMRGEETENNFSTLKLENTERSTDLAFSIDVDPEIMSDLRKRIKENSKDRLLVGISPSSVLYNYCNKHDINYTKTISEFADYLIDKGFYVVLVPHSIRLGSEKLKNNDLPVTKFIFDKIRDKTNCLFFEEDLNSEELRAIIGACNYFIASRFHAMISSLSTKVPTLVFGWSHKYREILRMFDLEEYCFDYKELNLDALIEKFILMEKNSKEIRKNLDENLPRIKELSYKQIDFIKNLLRT